MLKGGYEFKRFEYLNRAESINTVAWLREKGEFHEVRILNAFRLEQDGKEPREVDGRLCYEYAEVAQRDNPDIVRDVHYSLLYHRVKR